MILSKRKGLREVLFSYLSENRFSGKTYIYTIVLSTAEKLYTAGYISYPRTETNIFPKELNLVPLVEMQTGDARWGNFAAGVLQG